MLRLEIADGAAAEVHAARAPPRFSGERSFAETNHRIIRWDYTTYRSIMIDLEKYYDSFILFVDVYMGKIDTMK